MYCVGVQYWQLWILSRGCGYLRKNMRKTVQERSREKLSDIINYISHCNINCILGIWKCVCNVMSWMCDIKWPLTHIQHKYHIFDKLEVEAYKQN